MDSNHHSPACHAGVFALGPRDHSSDQSGSRTHKITGSRPARFASLRTRSFVSSGSAQSHPAVQAYEAQMSTGPPAASCRSRYRAERTGRMKAGWTPVAPAMFQVANRTFTRRLNRPPPYRLATPDHAKSGIEESNSVHARFRTAPLASSYARGQSAQRESNPHIRHGKAVGSPLHHGRLLRCKLSKIHEHRVGLEPTSPHYGCGVFAARRPVLVVQ